METKITGILSTPTSVSTQPPSIPNEITRSIPHTVNTPPPPPQTTK